MEIKWYYCKWCGWQAWTHENEKPNSWANEGCDIDANPEHQGGPHRWIKQGVWHHEEEPNYKDYIGE